jgi:hypothetical protein
MEETRLKSLEKLGAAPKRKRAAGPGRGKAAGAGAAAGAGSVAASSTRSARSTRSAGPPVVLSPARAAAGQRLAGMLGRVLKARNVAAVADDMRLVRENMRSRLVVQGKRKGRGARTQPRLADELMKEHAAGLAIDELEQVLHSAEQYVSSRSDASGLSADEALAVRQDVAMAALMFQGRADKSMNSKERRQLDALVERLAPVAVRSGEEGLAAATRRLRGLFVQRIGASEMRRRLASMLGGSAQLARLESVLASSVPGEMAASRSSKSAALSASRSSQVARRARAAVLAGQAARGSRSGDEAAAGTSTRSFVASQAGSLRSAKTSTRTSSKSAKTMTRSSQRDAILTPEEPLALRRARRVAAAPERYGVAEAAVLGLKDVAKRYAKAKAALKKGPAGSRQRSAANREMHALRVEFVLAMMQSLPGRLDAELRRDLDKMINTLFAGRDKAAREAALAIFAHKSVASMLRSTEMRRLRDMLAKLMSASELHSLQNEFDWISSVSADSRTPRGARSLGVRSEPVVIRSRLGSFSVDQSALSSARKPLFSTAEALDRLRSLVRGARKQRRQRAARSAGAAAGARAAASSASRSGASARSSSSASTWLKRANRRRAAAKR